MVGQFVLCIIIYLADSLHSTPSRIVKELLAPESTSASLSCEPLLTNDSCHSASWFKDGQPLGSSSSDKNLVLRFSTAVAVPDDVPQIGLLHLVGLRKGDDGRFWCICNGISGQVVRVRIVYLDSLFKTVPHVVHTSVGQSVVLQCNHPSGYPRPSVRWEKDGRLIRPDGLYKIVSAGELRLTLPTEAESGEYVCVAWNMMGERRLHHRLVVSGPAAIRNHNHNLKLVSKDSGTEAVCIIGIASYFLSAIVLLLLVLDVSLNFRPVLARLGVRLSRRFYRYPRANRLAHQFACPPPYDPYANRNLIAYQIPPPPYSIVGSRLIRTRPVSII